MSGKSIVVVLGVVYSLVGLPAAPAMAVEPADCTIIGTEGDWVSDAATESEDARTSVLRTLIERIVNPGTLFEESAIQLDSQLRGGYEAMIDGSGQVLSDAAQTISARLSRFAPGAAVELEWEGRPPSVTTPGVRARLVEGGHAAEIGRLATNRCSTTTAEGNG